MSTVDDPFKLLGVTREAPPEVVRAAYRALAQKYHPDRNESAQALAAMQAVNEAYAILSDPLRRAAWQSAAAARSEEQGQSRASSEPAGPGSAMVGSTIRRTVRGIDYEIVFQAGSVRDVREWWEEKTRIAQDHRLFVGRGRYPVVEQLPRQRLWVRVGADDLVIERSGEWLPVTAGHAVTLVAVRRPGGTRQAYPIALISAATARWYTLAQLRDAAGSLMTNRAHIEDGLRTLAILAAGGALIGLWLHFAGTILAWVAALLIGGPALWSLAPLFARTMRAALVLDMREALARAGLVTG